jgi:hypothetical protein
MPCETSFSQSRGPRPEKQDPEDGATGTTAERDAKAGSERYDNHKIVRGSRCKGPVPAVLCYNDLSRTIGMARNRDKCQHQRLS